MTMDSTSLRSYRETAENPGSSASGTSNSGESRRPANGKSSGISITMIYPMWWIRS